MTPTQRSLRVIVLVQHPAFVWGGFLALGAIPPVVTQLSATTAWHSIASRMMR